MVLLFMVVLGLLLTSCGAQPEDAPVQTETAAPETADTVTDAVTQAPEGYPYTFTVENGEEITVYLPREPEEWAELHLCDLDGTGNLNRVILHNTANGTGLWLEEVRVFDGACGEELAVVPVDDVIAAYVAVADSGDWWTLTISGAEYKIDKAQFSDDLADQLYEMPGFDSYRNFFVEHGQLYCDIGIVCAGAGMGFAKESLRIRYGCDAGRIVPAEITFLRDASESSDDIPTA